MGGERFGAGRFFVFAVASALVLVFAVASVLVLVFAVASALVLVFAVASALVLVFAVASDVGTGVGTALGTGVGSDVGTGVALTSAVGTGVGTDVGTGVGTDGFLHLPFTLAVLALASALASLQGRKKEWHHFLAAIWRHLGFNHNLYSAAETKVKIAPSPWIESNRRKIHYITRSTRGSCFS